MKRLALALGFGLAATGTLAACVGTSGTADAVAVDAAVDVDASVPITRSLANVRSASVYESVLFGTPLLPRPDGLTALDLLNEAPSEYIHRGYYRVNSIAELANSTLLYDSLAQQIAALKDARPGLLFGGATTAQQIGKTEFNPMTNVEVSASATWAMALDLCRSQTICAMTKEAYQTSDAPPGQYIPDVMNLEFQALLLSWIEKQMDCGADSIWIDGLFTQAGNTARRIEAQTGDAAAAMRDDRVAEVFASINRIVDDIHALAVAKGRPSFLVGSWTALVFGGYQPLPDLDFVTTPISKDEVRAMSLDPTRWDQIQADLAAFYPPETHHVQRVLAFLDWSFTRDTGLGVFSQESTTSQQAQALEAFDRGLADRNILFAYPTHGGNMGLKESLAVLAFGTSTLYDSVAPEFQTYYKIRELARAKVGAPPATAIDAPTEASTVHDTIEVRASIAYRVGVTRVRFYVDDQLLGESIGPQYQVSWPTADFADGPHVLASEVVDVGGVASRSADVQVVVDNVH